MVSLREIVPSAQTNISTQFIVLEKGRTSYQGQNKICVALVADETAAVHYQFWGDECDDDAFEPGDILRLVNGIFSQDRRNWVLRAGKRGKVEKIGEFTMVYVETPNMSEIKWLFDKNSNRYVEDKNKL